MIKIDIERIKAGRADGTHGRWGMRWGDGEIVAMDAHKAEVNFDLTKKIAMRLSDEQKLQLAAALVDAAGLSRKVAAAHASSGIVDVEGFLERFK